VATAMANGDYTTHLLLTLQYHASRNTNYTVSQKKPRHPTRVDNFAKY